MMRKNPEELDKEMLVVEKKRCDNWRSLGLDKCCLGDFIIEEERKIEDWDYRSIKVDFANKYIGGGVLNYGCVQEEILFSIHPELIVTMVFCKVMKDNEAFVIRGARRVAEYRGYAWEFRYTKKYEEINDVDSRGYIKNTFVAIDALMFPNFNEQFEDHFIIRELTKAYAGFSLNKSFKDITKKLPIVTGKWGCGEFGGFAPLKILIQWIAASAAGRKIVISTFKDPILNGLQQVMDVYKGKFPIQLLRDIKKCKGKNLLRDLYAKANEELCLNRSIQGEDQDRQYREKAQKHKPKKCSVI
jgi:poly(ADP-ribose) glycohydrolase